MAKTTIEKAQPVLQTANLPKKPEGMVFDIIPPTKGPSTGATLVEDDADWLRRHVKPEELAKIKASFQAQIERDAVKGWRVLPSGLKIPASMVLAICTNCKAAFWTTPEHADGKPCLICNNNLAKAGGMMRPATPKEVKSWTAKEAAAREKFIADGPRRKAELDAFNLRQRQDLGPGKNPFAKD